MSNLFRLTEAQMARLQLFFPKSIRRSENSPGDCFPEDGRVGRR
jgi:hypothetical protein